ncbi:hypothetical protein B0T14DRAFT_514267 [Immersiella caudata]|uniref:Uncharacterized protein n=1 Tax=Immersiella caudata TaxID=314043 RepID=A0AA39WWR6_9PEZI|nr:hypothetical protein B0T14DRAFT_514267 [Immersiella caudata]
MVLHANAIVLPSSPPSPLALHTPLRASDSFVGHILDGSYALSALVREDLARQERLYLVSCAASCGDTAIFAKEFTLTNIPPKLYKSRRRNMRKFANQRNVLCCIDHCGKKFIVFDLVPKEVDKKGKGKALDPELDEEDDDSGASRGYEEGGADGMKAQSTGSDAFVKAHGANEPQVPLLGGPPDDDNKAKAQARRPRPRRGQKRKKSSTPEAGALVRLQVVRFRGHQEVHVVGISDDGEGAFYDSDVSDSDWDSMDEDLDDKLQVALEVTSKEEYERYLLDMERALRISRVDVEK